MAGASCAILLTAPHPAAIAVIRLAGPDVGRFCATHLDRPPSPSRPVYCNLIVDSEPLDDIVVVQVADDTVDLNVHGGIWIVQSVLDLARRFGFDVTDARDAPRNVVTEAADPIEQQVQLDLPHAHTREALAILLAQPDAWKTMLHRSDSAEIRRAIEDRSLEHLLNPPTVAIIGAPNVGKSTLANQLFARDHSITADLPGTTRDWVGERANLDGLIVTLVDTPGQRHTDDPIEAAAIERAGSVIARADLVVIVLDASRDIEPAEAMLMTPYPDAIVVANKSDLSAARIDTAIPISARTGQGVDALRRAIRSRFGCAELQSLHARCWTDAQRAMLRRLHMPTPAGSDPTPQGSV